MSKPDPKVVLVNEIIQLSNIRDEYWRYHPDNPDRIDVVKEIVNVDKAITTAQNKIAELDK